MRVDGGAGPVPRVAGGIELHGEGGDERDRAVVEDVQERDLAAAVSFRASLGSRRLSLEHAAALIAIRCSCSSVVLRSR